MFKLPKLASRTALDKLLLSRPELPARFFLATNAKETIYSNEIGDRVYGRPEDGAVDEDTVIEMFSQTKLVTSVSALQVVDEGLITLDDPEVVAKYLPELAELHVITGYNDDGSPMFEAPNRPTTLRMLLSHTAGFIYPRANSIITKYVSDNNWVGIYDGGGLEFLKTPRAYQPGESWAYSHSVDWAGVLIERATKMSLEDHMKKNIFEPLGITSMTFYPKPELMKRKMWLVKLLVKKDGTRTFQTTKNGFRDSRPTDPKDVGLLLGGAGLYGSQKDYLAFLRGILAANPDNPDPPAKPLLSAAGFKELFTPSVHSVEGKEKLVEYLNSWIPVEPLATTETADHSPAMCLTLNAVPGRRAAGSGYWAGMGKSNFWVDPASGLAGICASNFLSPYAEDWEPYCVQMEETLYSSLQ